MTKRLYQATVELYVYAENSLEAAFEAIDAFTTHVEWGIEEIDDLSEIPDLWHDAIPWGEGKEDRTIRKILDKGRGKS